MQNIAQEAHLIVLCRLPSTNVLEIDLWFDEDFEPHKPLGQNIRESLAINWNIPEDKKATFLDCPLKDLQREYNRAQKKPILIISYPVCSESVILSILDEKLPYDKYQHAERDKQINGLKNKLKTLFNKELPIEFYRKHLSKEKLEEKRKIIPQLDLLIKMITNPSEL